MAATISPRENSGPDTATRRKSRAIPAVVLTATIQAVL